MTHSKSNDFSIKKAFQFALRIYKTNWKFLILASILIVVLELVPSYLELLTRVQLPAISLIFSIIAKVMGLLTSIGTIIICLKYVDGKKPLISDVYSHYRQLVTYLIANLSMAVLVSLGILLPVVCYFLALPYVGFVGAIFIAIIPLFVGLTWVAYVGVNFQYALFIVIDKKTWPLKAFKQSKKIVVGARKKILYVGLIFICIFFPILYYSPNIGLLIAMPFYLLVNAYIYRQLIGNS